MTAFSLFSGPDEILKSASPRISNAAASYFQPQNGLGVGVGGWGTGSPSTQIQQYQEWVRTAVAMKSRLVFSVPSVVRVTHEDDRIDYRKSLGTHRRLLEKSRSDPSQFPTPPRPAHRRFVSRLDYNSGKVFTKDWKPQEELEFLSPDDRLSRLFQNPNGPMTGEQFWRFFGTYWYLCGDVFLLVLPDTQDGLPAEMWVIPTHWVHVSRTSGVGQELRYDVRADGRVVAGLENLSSDVLMRFHNPHPWHPSIADSPIDAMAKTIDILSGVQEAQFNELRNRPFVPGMFEMDPNTTIGGIESIQSALSQIQSAYFGFTSAGRTPPLPPGVKWVPGNTTHEIGFQTSNDKSRASVLGQFGLDESMMGYSNESTHAAALVVDRRILKNLTKPDQRLVASWLTERILRLFSDRTGEEYRVVFHHEDVMEDPDEKRNNMLACGDGLSMNEQRVAMGWEPYDHEMADIPARLIPYVMEEEEFPTSVNSLSADDDDDPIDSNDGDDSDVVGENRKSFTMPGFSTNGVHN